jgi:hypothetical protein
MFKLIIKALGLVRDFEDAQTSYGKRWFVSKTLWVNIVAIIALLIQRYYGTVLSTEDQAVIIAAINIALRPFTKQPIVMKESSIVDMKGQCNDVPDRS